MEFSSSYGISSASASVNKTLLFRWATFTDASGVPVAVGETEQLKQILARALLAGPVFACLDRAGPQLRTAMRRAQPNFFIPFDRMQLDPFVQRFPIALRCEGTVRGTGGVRVVDTGCRTSVRGLFAAGDVATRELICGAFTGGGNGIADPGANGAWALSSGNWAGRAAADEALSSRQAIALAPETRPLGRVAFARETRGGAFSVNELVDAVQAEVLPYDKNMFRTKHSLQKSYEILEALWRGLNHRDEFLSREAFAGREAVAMIAHARWMYASALDRQETRGMHFREDYPLEDLGQQRRILASGLERIRITLEGPEAQLPPDAMKRRST